MYHKPAGTNQQEKVIFEANGDVAVHIRQGRSDTPHTNDDTAGYLIVAMPADSLSAPTDDKIAFRFNLGGAGCGRTVPATDVYPETVLAPHSYGGWSGSLLANLADKLHASLGMDAVLSVSGEAAATFVGAALGPDVLHGFLLGDFLVVIFRWTTSVADATSGPAARNELVLPTGGVGARWYRLHQENRF
jgi:hypothetical protein